MTDKTKPLKRKGSGMVTRQRKRRTTDESIIGWDGKWADGIKEKINKQSAINQKLSGRVENENNKSESENSVDGVNGIGRLKDGGRMRKAQGGLGKVGYDEYKRVQAIVGYICACRKKRVGRKSKMRNIDSNRDIHSLGDSVVGVK